MKIAVISDTHFGHGWGTEIEGDSFRQAGEAIGAAIAEKADLILLGGDIFHHRMPRQEVWGKALAILQKPLLAEKSPAKLVGTVGKDGNGISRLAFSGIPVIAIFGTHEKRGSHATNPVQVLEQGGYLMCLHHNGLIFEAGAEHPEGCERVCVQGLSGVPDNYAKLVLEKWAPAPVDGCVNLLMLHQSLKEYVYSGDEDAFLSVADLPKGFDLYVCGHIHPGSYLPEEKLLIVGSTVITQLRKAEADRRKGFTMIETAGGKITAVRNVELKSQRPFHYVELDFKDADIAEVVSRSRAEIQRLVPTDSSIKPMIRLKLTGSMQKGRESSGISESDIKKGYERSAIISVDRELEGQEFTKKIQMLREMQQKKMSVDEMGLGIIRRLLAETKYCGPNPDELIELLADGEVERVIQRATEPPSS